MIKEGGLFIEYLSYIGLKWEYFFMRNCIVVGFCDVFVVVEIGKEGGFMIIVQFVNDYNKDVFVFLGRVKDFYVYGGNYLIKSY